MGKNKTLLLLFFLVSLCFTFTLISQEPQPVAPVEAVEQPSPTLISQMTVLAGLAVLPFAVMLLTSYVKIVVVLSLLRNALGVQQSPPNQVLNGIALLMTVYVMYPT